MVHVQNKLGAVGSGSPKNNESNKIDLVIEQSNWSQILAQCPAKNPVQTESKISPKFSIPKLSGQFQFRSHV